MSTHRTLALLAGLAASAFTFLSALADVTIYGGLSNFDVPNETDDDCDEFEIELHGPNPEDIYHTYTNPNYGHPQIIATTYGTLVRYANPRHLTLPGSIEHFGISLRNFNADPTPKFRWMKDGQEAGVNPNPLQPQITTTASFNNEGDPVIVETITNLDPWGRRMWVKRSVTNVLYTVSLEELMVDEPLIQDSDDLDLAPVLLNHAQTLTYNQLESGDGIASAVLSYEVYRDSFYANQHHVGSYAGTVMNAVQLNTLGCSDGGLVIQKQPEDVFAVPGDTVDFSVSVDNNGDFGDPVFHWYHEGVEFAVTTSDTLSIPNITYANAGAYYVMATNDCGTVISTVGRLDMPRQCLADIDGDGFVNALDYDDFADAFENADITADFNADGFINALDYDGFAEHFEAGC
ncbi:MAG: hypothetical protein IT432_11440 [Phycisphaerales bacterium]|nr:hypothetical protein [Phycisphaerales bacterium]